MCLAIPGQIRECFDKDGLPMGLCDFNGLRREICLSYVPDAGVGDYVLVHVGFALSRLDPEEAERTLRLLDEMSQLGEREQDPAS